MRPPNGSELEDDSEKLSKAIPVLPDYVKGLKERYLAKITVIVVYPASIPIKQVNRECLLPMEVLDLLGYLVLETSHLYEEKVQGLQKFERLSIIKWFWGSFNR